MESIDEAIAKAKAQASRLPAIINARKLTMSDLEIGSLDVEELAAGRQIRPAHRQVPGGDRGDCG